MKLHCFQDFVNIDFRRDEETRYAVRFAVIMEDLQAESGK